MAFSGRPHPIRLEPVRWAIFFAHIKIAQSAGDGYLERPLVPRAGLEPARANAHQILSLARLPIPPPRHERALQNYWLLYHAILALDKGIFLFFW